MPWSNQTGGGGGWKSGGGNGGGPWGQGPQGQRPGNKSPDLEEILKRGQDRLRRAIPGGGGGGRGGPGAGAGGSGGGLALGGLLLVLFAVIWAFNAIHMVQPGEYGVKVFLGKPREQLANEGLNFTLWPLETFATVPAVENQLAIGRTGTDSTGGNSPGLMLSGDQNIVNVQFSVLYRIDKPQDYLFNVDDPQGMLRQVSESAMREVVGRRPVDEVFRDNRAGIAESVRAIIQDALDRYGSGIRISGVSIEDAAPPQQVATAFEEVQRAGQDQIRFVEEASLYRNQQLGRARGEALQIREDAAAEKNRLIQDAEGESQRFTDILDEYEKAPEVTRKRLFLETMESVYGDSKKVLVDGSVGQQGVVPYLPLGSLQTPAAPNAATPARPAGQTGNTIPASPATIQGTN
jgi:membrane protease subunit HflK